MLDAIKHITDDIFVFQEDSALVDMHCACNSPTAAALSTSFLLNHAPPNSPELSASMTRFRESYSSVSMSPDSKKTEEIKEQL